MLDFYEKLLGLGFSKTEIDSGEYRSENLIKHLNEWELLEEKIKLYRGSRLLQLISYVAKKEEN